MPDIRDVVISRIKKVGVQSIDSVAADDVQKVADHISIVSKVTDEAGKLVGLDKLQKERRDMEQKLEQTQAELEKQKMEVLTKELAEIKAALKGATEQRDIPAIKELEHKLEEAREAYHKEQLDSLRKEIAELRKPEKGAGDIAEEIRKIKETAQTLGLTSGADTTPPDILLQLKQMDHDLQIKLAEMAKEDKRRDKEWQLTVKKWDEERELRKAEASSKYEAEHERTEVIKSAIDRGSRIIGRAVMEEEEATPSRPTSYHIEAEEGEMGEFTCPECKAPVSIAPDTTTAICAKCGFRTKVARKAKSGT